MTDISKLQRYNIDCTLHYDSCECYPEWCACTPEIEYHEIKSPNGDYVKWEDLQKFFDIKPKTRSRTIKKKVRRKHG